MSDIIETLLLLALPASGKSEVRRYLASMAPEVCQSDFRLGPTVQIDDFPYVHVMRCIDDELATLGEERVFFHAPDRSFRSTLDWGTLIELINEDYDDLVASRKRDPATAAEDLLRRIDAASEKVGLPARLAALSATTRAGVAKKLGDEARSLLANLEGEQTDSLKGKTVVIEFARGGPDGASLPLDAAYGYKYSLAQLSDAILSTASILYIWVTPEESRRKNADRADPDDPGSILHHGVPLEVMLGDYGCDDMGWLEQQSETPGAIEVERDGKKYTLPLGRFDNRVDKTSFIRKDRADWAPDEVKAIHDGLTGALQSIK